MRKEGYFCDTNAKNLQCHKGVQKVRLYWGFSCGFWVCEIYNPEFSIAWTANVQPPLRECRAKKGSL